MREHDEIIKLLTEIRDAQREHLAEYREVTRRSLEMQQQSVRHQELLSGLYRRALIGGGLVVLFIILVILLLLRRVL